MADRLSWDDYFLGIAEAVSRRGDCTRRQVGAVIVRDHRIVSTGYNGAPPGLPGCLSAGACPRGRHYQMPYNPAAKTAREADLVVCACGKAWPCPDAVPPTSSYDTGPGACIASHSEANAIIYAGRDACLGATIYMVPGKPCDGCKRLILAAGIKCIVWSGPDGDGMVWL